MADGSNPELADDEKKAQDESLDPEFALTRRVTQVKSYSGPIPPAEDFSRYEEVYPGSADRLFSMAEREQENIASFRNKSLVATSLVAIITVAAIALILTVNPDALVLVALAIAYALPAIADFIRGIIDSALSKRERELEIQIRKDNHELDMIAAKKRLQLTSGSDEPITQRARRLESDGEAADARENRA